MGPSRGGLEFGCVLSTIGAWTPGASSIACVFVLGVGVCLGSLRRGTAMAFGCSVVLRSPAAHTRASSLFRPDVRGSPRGVGLRFGVGLGRLCCCDGPGGVVSGVGACVAHPFATQCAEKGLLSSWKDKCLLAFNACAPNVCS